MPAGEILFVATMNENEAAALAARFAKILKPGDCIALHGELGAGKSNFARAAIKAMTDAKEIPSPTYTLVQSYESKAGTIWHFDAYRLKKPEDIYELGWEDALTGIIFVEWAERITAFLPPSHLAITFEYAHTSKAEPDQRQITLKGNSSWASRLSPVLPRHPKT